jgi:lipopolysaccharide transport protein LptA
MRQTVILITTFLLLFGLAQEQTTTTQTDTSQTDTTGTDTTTSEQTAEEKRIIRIQNDGGTQSGDLRFGPITYEHPDLEGVVATVSNLTIYGQKAELKGPEGEEVSLTDAEGRRIATFSGGLRVTRNKLEAKGPDLTYSEETGIGTMTGNVAIVVAPDKEGGDPVNINAESADFNVDTDVSISKGNVQLENGNQSATANEVTYEENRKLAKMTPAEGDQVTLTRTDKDGNVLTITADVVRPLTEGKRLHAIGNVTIVDGAGITKGDEVFFDDKESRAEITGNPATYENDEDGASLSSGRLEQFTDTDTVQPLDETVPSKFDAKDFQLTEELASSGTQ